MYTLKSHGEKPQVFDKWEKLVYRAEQSVRNGFRPQAYHGKELVGIFVPDPMDMGEYCPRLITE